MTLPPPTKDQETCSVYSAPVALLPFFCSKTHGSGVLLQVSSAQGEMQCWPLAKPSHPTAIAPGGPKGLEWCVYDDREHSKGQAQPEGQGGSVPTCASLPPKAPAPICAL